LLPVATSETAVLITGASSGFGVQFAKQLAALGYSLALVARREERLQELAKELTASYGVTVEVIPCDLTDPVARDALVDEVKSKDFKLVGLCNNAGFGTHSAVLTADPDRELQMLRLNVEALTDLTQKLLPEIVANSPGAVLNVASTAAFNPLPKMAAYAATKSYVLAYSEALHVELQATGVSCTTLCPGPSATEFSATTGDEELFTNVPKFMMVAPEKIVQQGVKGMLSGDRVVIPGLGSKALALAAKVLPRRVLIRGIK